MGATTDRRSASRTGGPFPRSALVVGTCLLLAAGCKRPPEAPAELDDLCGFLYAHIGDEDDEALRVGLENLDAWLDEHMASTLEGYEVTNLSQEAVDALEGGERDLDGLAGAAVGNLSPHSVDDLVWALTDVPQEDIFDNYEVFERDYLEGEGCFPDRDCLWMVAENYSETNFALGLNVVAENKAQFRWVEVPDLDWVMIHRTWLRGPAEVNGLPIKVREQFYLTVTLKAEQVRRLQSTWIVSEFSGAKVPEATALNQVIKAMQNTAEALDTYLDENG